MSGLAPLLVCHELTRHFGGVVALAGLDLELRQGEILGLIGPNGSGKTTFFNVLTGLYPATRGEILFAGTSLSQAKPQAIYRAGVTRTFQRSRLCLELSIFDNLAIGAHQRLDHGLWFNLLRRDSLADQADTTAAAAQELLQIFDPPLAARIFEPMAGFAMIDRRRVEICRALMSRPRLLLLDEPSAGMTADETTRLMDDILEVRRRFGDLTIVLIEHEMSVIAKVTDRCVVLNYGKKLCEGTYAEVSSDAEVRRAYLGLT
jgi:ABC-type branched-subunit amino acid transport system ATPase component